MGHVRECPLESAPSRGGRSGPPTTTCTVAWVHPSPHHKRHLDRFMHFRSANNNNNNGLFRVAAAISWINKLSRGETICPGGSASVRGRIHSPHSSGGLGGTDGSRHCLMSPPLRRGNKNVTNADDIGKNRMRCGLLMTYSTKLGLLTNDVELQ